MDISKTLLKLRRDKDITQEKLASVLGISFQTVSKWERNESYPDITLLPVLAAYFNTTVDFLLGTDEERKKLRRYESSKCLAEIRKNGNRKETISFLRGEVREYPDDYGSMKILANELKEFASTLADKNEADKLRREALDILERALELVPNDGWRHDINYHMIECLWSLGEHDKATDLAHNKFISDDELWGFFMKNSQGHERISHAKTRILQAFEKYAEAIECMVDFEDEHGCGFSNNEKLKKLKFAYGMVPLVFDDDKCQKQSETASRLCVNIAELYAKADDIENAFYYLDRAAKYAKEYDEVEQIDINKNNNEIVFSGLFVHSLYTSTLLNELVIGEFEDRSYKEPTASGELLKKYLPRPAFDVLRNDPRFGKIERQLNN